MKDQILPGQLRISQARALSQLGNFFVLILVALTVIFLFFAGSAVTPRLIFAALSVKILHMSKLKVGIIGLPNAGKSTLFNALLGQQVANTAPYPFCTIEPNVGVVPVPDSRLEQLVKVVLADEPKASPVIIPAVVEFYDIAGLVKGAHEGEGLGNQFLSHIREVDALVQVARSFVSDTVVQIGSLDPKEDIETINTELVLKDLETLEKQKGPNPGVKLSLADQNFFSGLEKLRSCLNAGQLAVSAPLTDDERKETAKLSLLTSKPMIYVLNVDEENLFRALQEAGDDSDFLPICAKLEQDLQDLTESERSLYLKELGLSQPGLVRLTQRCYKLLGLISFLTAGPKEVRAWSIPLGSTAPQAAGVIHTDFERGFIRASLVPYKDLVESGSFSAAKAKGWVREEGKSYIIADGDVVEFRFSV